MRQNADAILKTYKLLGYGSIHYIFNSVGKNVPKKQRHPSLDCELHFYKCLLLWVFLLHMVYREAGKTTYIYLYVKLFFIL